MPRELSWQHWENPQKKLEWKEGMQPLTAREECCVWVFWAHSTPGMFCFPQNLYGGVVESYLGGGLKHFLFSLLPGEDSQFD